MRVFELEKKLSSDRATLDLSKDQMNELSLQETTNSLYEAIVNGSITDIQECLSRNEEWTCKEHSPFMLACSLGQLDIGKLLFTQDLLLERNTHGNTPLLDAALHGQKECVAWLLSEGADINAQNIHGDTALSLSLRFNHPEVADLLLSQEQIDVHTASVLGYEPIVIAIVQDHLSIVEKLYQPGVDLNKHYTENNTLLHLCAIKGNIESIYWLLAHGANPHLRNKDGITPLVTAAIHRHFLVVAALMAELKPHEHSSLGDELDLVLMAASKNGDLDIINLVIDYKKAHKQSCSSMIKHIMLLHGVLFNHFDVIDRVLELDPKKKEKKLNKHFDYGDYPHNQNDTLLHAAAKTGHFEMLQKLITLGAKLNVTNFNKDSVLHYAVRSGNVDMVRWLCKQKDIEVNKKNKQGNTALHLAVELGHIDVVRALLMHGADPALENKQKQNVAVLAEHSPVMKNCIAAFKARELSDFGLTELHLAATNRQDKAILECLPKVGDMNTLSVDGLTPIQITAHLGNLHSLVILLLWQNKGSQEKAQQQAVELSKDFEPSSVAYKTLKAAKKEIPLFPENRLNAIKVGSGADRLRFFSPVKIARHNVQEVNATVDAAAGVGI